VQASVFFGSDIANPDTVAKFWADLQMFAFTMGEPDPRRFMDQYVSWEAASKANQWQGRNYLRWRNDDYDAPTGPPTANSTRSSARRCSSA
jgi:peptide/nickel transport system substrate-binding protein